MAFFHRYFKFIFFSKNKDLLVEQEGTEEHKKSRTHNILSNSLDMLNEKIYTNLLPAIHA
jgi:hypothetical protein